ncbi:MAG: glycosyltransferase [Anaerolineales bacterium]
MDTKRNLKGLAEYQNARQDHWDAVARSLESWRGWGGYYHRRLAYLLQGVIPPGHQVLEIGCGEGNLLAAVEPALGIGVDFSTQMCRRAAAAHPQLEIVQGDAHYLPLAGQFDYIILSDLLNDLWDVQQALKQIQHLCHPHTRVIINVYSKLWEIPLEIAQNLKLAKPNLPQNWFSPQDLEGMLRLEDFELVKSSQEIIFPFYIPLLTPFLNRFLGKFWPFKHLALTNLIIARPTTCPQFDTAPPRVSVVIPARNEAGNIEDLFTRTPEMGGGTELIFVEGNSQDSTRETIQEYLHKYPDRDARLLLQTGRGKGDAVRLGFEGAAGEILMILDADLSVAPEDLILFYEALLENKGDFINGVRLVYPMEDQAMRFLNLLGNKFFSSAFSWLLGQPIKDTLCGTKVLYRSHYQQIARNRDYFGDFDPYGDFDLLFGAAKLNLKIVDLPIRYRSRVYGSTNIDRFQGGYLLLRMVLFAAWKLKFI